MQAARRLKAVVIAGALAGALLGMGTALSMDLVYDASLGGSWQHGITSDLHRYFSYNVSETSLIVTFIFLAILTVLGAFGATMGAICAVIVYKFLGILLRK